jgi:uncharacterized OB-fold protein
VTAPAATRPVEPGLFEIDGDGALHLLGGYSPTSDQYHFPLAEVCPYTGAADVEPVRLGRDATLWAWTTVLSAPPGYRGEVPYGFGIVELVEEKLRIVTRLTGIDPATCTFGQPMQAVADVLHVDDDGTPVLTWAFAC